MRIGILQCGSVAADLRPTFSDYPQMFEQSLSAASPTLEFRSYDLTAGRFPASLDECDSWLFTGGKWSVYDNDGWIRRAEELAARLHRSHKPTLGICFGHQLIAAALGGRVERASLGWRVGVQTTRIHTRPEWMEPATEQLALLVSHQDQVIAPPPGALHLAGDESCPYSMLQIDDHMLTFQGHPEFSKDYAKALMNRRRAQIGEQVYEAGISSLTLAVNEDIAAQWMVRFLYGA